MKTLPKVDEKIGRWSLTENRLFEEALSLYGKNWKLITGYIKTRNLSQVRSHAQKHHIKELLLKQGQKHKNPSKNNSPINISELNPEISTQYGEGMLFPVV